MISLLRRQKLLLFFCCCFAISGYKLTMNTYKYSKCQGCKKEATGHSYAFHTLLLITDRILTQNSSLHERDMKCLEKVPDFLLNKMQD